MNKRIQPSRQLSEAKLDKEQGRLRKGAVKHLSDAMSLAQDVQGGVEELHDEIQNWFDNMPEGPQSGSKGDAVQECADNLETVQDAAQSLYGALDSLPGTMAVELKVEYTQDERKTAWSRAGRLDNLSTIVAAIQSALERLKKKMDPTPSEEEIKVEDVIDEATEACEEIINAMADVTFPGMMG